MGATYLLWTDICSCCGCRYTLWQAYYVLFYLWQDIFEAVNKAYEFLCSKSKLTEGPDPKNIVLILKAQSILFSRYKDGLYKIPVPFGCHWLQWWKKDKLVTNERSNILQCWSHTNTRVTQCWSKLSRWKRMTTHCFPSRHLFLPQRVNWLITRSTVQHLMRRNCGEKMGSRSVWRW